MNTPITPAIALALLTVLVTLGYLGLVWLRPFKTCRRCSGMGRIPARSGRGRPRPCRRCKTTGIRLRLGRRVIGHVRTRLADARIAETGTGTLPPGTAEPVQR